MQSNISRWGNSLAIRIPKNIIQKANLKEGDILEMALKNNEIKLTQPKPKFTLESLTSQITPQNLHQETDWSTKKGKEVW